MPRALSLYTSYSSTASAVPHLLCFSNGSFGAKSQKNQGILGEWSVRTYHRSDPATAVTGEEKNKAGQHAMSRANHQHGVCPRRPLMSDSVNALCCTAGERHSEKTVHGGEGGVEVFRAQRVSPWVDPAVRSSSFLSGGGVGCFPFPCLGLWLDGEERGA